MKKCMICDQETNFVVTTFRNKLFIDGKNYATMCFGCAWTPVQTIQTYSKTGEVENEEGPFFDHKHLVTAEELVEQGSVDSLAEGKKCVIAVKRKIKEAGARSLSRLNLKRPPLEYDLMDEPRKKRTRNVK